MAKTITEPRRKIKMDWKDRLFHTINYTAFILFALICFLSLLLSVYFYNQPQRLCGFGKNNVLPDRDPFSKLY